jgi:hypothetical protein
MSCKQQQQQQENPSDQSILDKITNTECAICLSNLTHTNFTSTECGHWFHSSCIFQNMMERVECPLCRKELAKLPEYESDDDDEDMYDESEDDESEDDESEDDDESDDDDQEISIQETNGGEITEPVTSQPIDNSITCKQATQKMLELGYNIEDLMYLLVGRLDPREKTKYKRTFRHKMEHDLQHILSGDIQVDYRDSRTYAEVMSGSARREEAGIGPRTVAHI